MVYIKQKRKGGPGMYIKRFVKHYYIMLIPALLWLFFFSIVPMFGIVMAFQDYNARVRVFCILSLSGLKILSTCFK